MTAPRRARINSSAKTVAAAAPREKPRTLLIASSSAATTVPGTGLLASAGMVVLTSADMANLAAGPVIARPGVARGSSTRLR